MAVGANETVMEASKLQETMRCIKQLEGALDCKTLGNEIITKVVDFAKVKIVLRARQYCQRANGDSRLLCPLAVAMLCFGHE